MTKYSALLFRPETYHHIGPFRFPIYHDLVPGEAKGIEEISKKQSKTTFKSIKLAQRIAKDKGISTKEAVDLLGKVSEDEDTSILFDYAEELEALEVETIGGVEQRVLFVTLFMQYRAEAQLEGEEWQQLKDWTSADTEAVPGKLFNQIHELLLWERDGWPTPDEGKPAEPGETFSPPRKKS